MQRHLRYLICLGMLVGWAWPACGQAPSPVELRLDTNARLNARFITPRRAMDYRGTNIQGDSGTVRVNSQDVAISARTKGRSEFIGIDVNASGQIDRDEWTQLRDGAGVLKFDMTVDERSQPACLLVENAYLRSKGGKVLSFWFDLVPCWAMKGRADKTDLWLLDSNLDGRYTQDGQDAIIIGRTQYGLPLMTNHLIDGRYYTLSVAEDGTKIELSETADVSAGQVRHGFGRAAGGLVLVGQDGSAYDIVTDGRAGIPAGTYRLQYGVLSHGRDNVYIDPPESGTFEIKADQLNTVNLGEPFLLKYSATLRADKVQIAPELDVLGAQGERYRFRKEDRELGRPVVAFMEGDRQLKSGKFEYG